MEIIFEILYQEEVVKKDIPAFSPEIKKIIKSAIEKKLQTKPHIYGKPLRNSLFGFRSLRIGDYRVIFQIILPQKVVITVIQHRSRAYEIASKRST